MFQSPQGVREATFKKVRKNYFRSFNHRKVCKLQHPHRETTSLVFSFNHRKVCKLQRFHNSQVLGGARFNHHKVCKLRQSVKVVENVQDSFNHRKVCELKLRMKQHRKTQASFNHRKVCKLRPCTMLYVAGLSCFNHRKVCKLQLKVRKAENYPRVSITARCASCDDPRDSGTYHGKPFQSPQGGQAATSAKRERFGLRQVSITVRCAS